MALIRLDRTYIDTWYDLGDAKKQQLAKEYSEALVVAAEKLSDSGSISFEPYTYEHEKDFIRAYLKEDGVDLSGTYSVPAYYYPNGKDKSALVWKVTIPFTGLGDKKSVLYGRGKIAIAECGPFFIKKYGGNLSKYSISEDLKKGGEHIITNAAKLVKALGGIDPFDKN